MNCIDCGLTACYGCYPDTPDTDIEQEQERVRIKVTYMDEGAGVYVFAIG